MGLALIIHGWPSPVSSGSKLHRLFREKGYEVVAPYLFEGDSFDLRGCLDAIRGSLNNKNPDVLVGLSMGGLILPYLAQSFPKAKLIFVATGTRFSPKLLRLRLAVKFMSTQLGRLAFVFVKFFPNWLIEKVGFWSAVREGGIDYGKYMAVARRNRRNLKRISSGVVMGVARFLLMVDTSDNLKKLKNRSLVVVSSGDVQMPEWGGVEVYHRLHDCEVFRTEGDHFRIMNKDVMKIIKSFI